MPKHNAKKLITCYTLQALTSLKWSTMPLFGHYISYVSVSNHLFFRKLKNTKVRKVNSQLRLCDHHMNAALISEI